MGINQQLVLEPRDEYSNICSYSPSADHSNSYAINVIDVSTSKYWWGWGWNTDVCWVLMEI